jgi:hypothetical protein
MMRRIATFICAKLECEVAMQIGIIQYPKGNKFDISGAFGCSGADKCGVATPVLREDGTATSSIAFDWSKCVHFPPKSKLAADARIV